MSQSPIFCMTMNLRLQQKGKTANLNEGFQAERVVNAWISRGLVAGIYPKGTEAHSVLLPGFKVPVGSALAGS